MPRSPALIIDGYNLLQESEIFGRVQRLGALHASRVALLDYLVSALPPRQLARSVIVFDAAEAPPGLPHQLNHGGLKVLFSRNKEDADTLIERLLEEHREPRGVLVVSSDHRLQRAARQCGASSIDSRAWFLEIQETSSKGRPGKDGRPAPADMKPEPRVSPAEKELWLAEFGPIDEAALLPPETSPTSAPPQNATPSDGTPSDKPRAKKARRPPSRKPPDEPDDRGPLNLANPFPPGYTDDLFEE